MTNAHEPAQNEAADPQDLLWVRTALARHLTTAWADVQDYVTRSYPGALTSTFTLTGSTWTIVHKPFYDDELVKGYDLEITQDIGGDYSLRHIIVAQAVMKEAGYKALVGRDGTVAGYRRLNQPFMPTKQRT